MREREKKKRGKTHQRRNHHKSEVDVLARGACPFSERVSRAGHRLPEYERVEFRERPEEREKKKEETDRGACVARFFFVGPVG